MLLLDAFNKDRASLPQPLQNPPALAPTLVMAPPDARTQEMINEKLKKAEDLGKYQQTFKCSTLSYQLQTSEWLFAFCYMLDRDHSYYRLSTSVWLYICMSYDH